MIFQIDRSTVYKNQDFVFAECSAGLRAPYIFIAWSLFKNLFALNIISIFFSNAILDIEMVEELVLSRLVTG